MACATHRPDTGGTRCVDCGTSLMQVFYADPVDEAGNVIGTAKLTITRSPYPVTVAKIPYYELGVDNTPTIRVREEDFPNG